jgi:hypothetical protein
MNDEPLRPWESLLSRLSSPQLDAGTSARVLKRAERELIGQRYRWQVWSGWALAAVLVASEAVYVVEVIAKVCVLFG